MFLVTAAETPGEYLPTKAVAAEASRTLLASLDAALGTSASQTADPLRHISQHVAERAMLLVVDTAGQLEAGASVLSELLARAPHLKLLVTARVPLHLPAERVLHVDGLRGENSHHILEAVFKSLALALHAATRIVRDDLPSTKGTL